MHALCCVDHGRALRKGLGTVDNNSIAVTIHTLPEADPGTAADPILDLLAGDMAQLRGCRRWPWRRHQDGFSAAV